MLNVGFIIPPDDSNHEPFRTHPLVALGLLTILEEKISNLISIKLIDLRGVLERHVKYYIPEMDVYMYTIHTPELFIVCAVKDVLRKLYPKAIHIAGGPHVNIFKEKVLTNFDSICIGEGENVIAKMITDIIAGNLKQIYVNMETININKYPHPNRKYLPPQSVAFNGLFRGENNALLATSALFSRGCPFNCHFCANVNLGKVRFRSPVLIEEEIEYLKKNYGIKAITIKDDNAIPFDKKVCFPYLAAIGRCGVKWRGPSRANGITEDMVRAAKDSGCTDLALGIESASQKVLNIINKKIDIVKAKKYIELLHKYDIGVQLQLIAGLPGESENVVEETLQFIDEVQPSSVFCCILTPLPGSNLTKNPEAFGIKIKHYEWNKYRLVFGRFDEEENGELVFEYMEETPWGKGRKSEDIIRDYRLLQKILRERNLNF